MLFILILLIAATLLAVILLGARGIIQLGFEEYVSGAVKLSTAGLLFCWMIYAICYFHFSK